VQTMLDVYAAWIEGLAGGGFGRHSSGHGGMPHAARSHTLAGAPVSAPGVLSHSQHFLAVVWQ
jgi:hypothetical protein